MLRRTTVTILTLLIIVSGVVPTFAIGGIVEANDTEPNDDFDTAQPVTEGTLSGEIQNGESDFYQITANTTDAIDAEVTNADSLSDFQNLALRIYDADRQQLVGDGNTNNGIDATIKAPETGTYYIEVAGQEQQTTSNYTLTLDIVTPAENDQFAPNDDFESAASVSEGFNEAQIVGGESDFYRITANTTDAIDAEVTNADSLSDFQNLALRIYDADRQQLVSDGNDFQGIDATIKAPETGTYYIEVAGQEQQTTSNYTLNLDVVTPTENDQFAPNDDFESAAPINQEFNDARVVGGESDFYKITLNQTEIVSAELRTADQLSSLSIRLYNPQLTQVTSDGNDFEGISVTHTATDPGAYYIEVAGQGQQTTSDYELQTNQTFIPEDATDITESPLEGAAGEFDEDGNGDISISELGQAGQAFASGELTITELGEVGAAFAS